MSNEALKHSHEAHDTHVGGHHDHHDDHGAHHEKENFWTKYVFSMDHKMISKQFLIRGPLDGGRWRCDVDPVPITARVARRKL